MLFCVSRLNQNYFICNIAQLHYLNKKSIIILLSRHSLQVDFDKVKVECLLFILFFLTIEEVDMLYSNNLCCTKIFTLTPRENNR